MKYRVLVNGNVWPHFFETKKEAEEFADELLLGPECHYLYTVPGPNGYDDGKDHVEVKECLILE